MEELIKEYEEERAKLKTRIAELNKRLKQGGMMTAEREKLIVRRDILTDERSDMLQVINEMKKRT